MAQRIAAIPKITANTPQPPPNCSIMVMARKPLTAAPPSSTKGCTGMPPSPKKNREYTIPQETMEPRMALLESLIGKSPSSTICGTVSNPKNGVIITVVANVADRAQMDAAAAQGVEKFGEINVACCNAGVCRLAPFEEMDDKTRDFHIDVNIKGVWNTCKAVIPYMLKQGGGNIVIASSVTGDIVADAGEAAYAMTKAALVGLTKCLAVEYASRNIRVNCSQLGYARTPMVEKMAVESNPENPEAAIADIAVGVPMKRLAKPIEVGELFAFLGSDESSYLTGSQIVIDGGSTLPETMSIGTN